MQNLCISENRRFLQTQDGAPFFYLADTAWELLHRASRAETEEYLDDRAAKRFSVVQTVVLAEEDGLRTPNAGGDLPLFDLDPTRPNEKYFAHVDWVVEQAAERGLTIGMLPTWGDKWSLSGGIGPEVFTPENAAIFGEWLGNRYRNAPLIWILGGDRFVENENHRAIIENMAAGLKAGDGGRHLMTFHPRGQSTSAQPFHDASWLDFNMWQTGHARDYPCYDSIAQDYARTPIKPCLNGEPGYENIPSALKRGNPLLNDYDARKFAYWSLFAGAFGLVYGCNEIWQWWQPGHVDREGKPPFDAHLHWREALQLPGAAQMQHARELIESRAFFSRVPDQSLIRKGQSEGAAHLQATRDRNGSYALIYFAASTPATIDLGKLNGEKIAAAWFDPRTGKQYQSGDFLARPQKFEPPTEEDWILTLDT